MPLNDEARLRIARKLLMKRLSEDGLHAIGQMLKREIPNIAKEVDEKPDDLKDFMHEILPEIICKKLGCSGVKLQWSSISN